MHDSSVRDSSVRDGNFSLLACLIRFTISSASSASASTSPQSCVASNFRFVDICVLVIVSDDVRSSVDDGMRASATIDVVAVVTWPSHRSVSINFSSWRDSSDDSDRLDMVNTDTVDAELSHLFNMLVSVFKMNDEFDVVNSELGKPFGHVLRLTFPPLPRSVS